MPFRKTTTAQTCCRSTVTLLALCGAPAPLLAQPLPLHAAMTPQSPADSDDKAAQGELAAPDEAAFADLSLAEDLAGFEDTFDEELEGLDGLDSELGLLFEDFDLVVSASRSKQNIARTAVPVSALSRKDIKYSGVREIPELLGLVPGVDTTRVDRNRWAIGVRGMHQAFSDRTLLLVNGRTASDPVTGGFDLQRLPLFLSDIERIEVVRGPGGGSWGANAFNGVINIIEKSPRDTTGVMLSQRLNDRGDSTSTMRFGHATESLAWRLTTEFDDAESSGTPFLNTGIAMTNSHANDFSRTRRFGLSGVYDFDEDTALEFGAGYAHVERGDAPFLSIQTGNDERIDRFNAHAKLNLALDLDTSGYIQWYGSHEDVSRPTLWRFAAFDNTIDSQITFNPSTSHEMTVGGTLRVVNITTHADRITDSLASKASAEYWAGLFFKDVWTISDHWSLETQVRSDLYSETKIDWAGRVALLYDIDADAQHTLRLALARAFRTPQHAVRELATSRIPVSAGPPVLYGINLVMPDALSNEEVYSIEFGYTGKLTEQLTLRADVYAQRYENLTGARRLDEPAPILGRQFFVLDNLNGANAFGLETELRYDLEHTSLSAWFAVNQLELDHHIQDIRGYQPATHKIGLRARTAITDWLTLNANYQFTDSIASDAFSGISTGVLHTLDLTATIANPSDNMELQIGVLDVFNGSRDLVYDQTTTSAAHETTGRSFFAKVQFKF